jgi:hypothetical protein
MCSSLGGVLHDHNSDVPGYAGIQPMSGFHGGCGGMNEALKVPELEK